MYIEAIRFKREENSEWESGYYVGKYENCKESVLLDENYRPLLDENEKIIDVIWNYHGRVDGIRLNIPEINEVN